MANESIELRRRFRFNLRTLFVVIVAASLACVVVSKLNHYDEARREAEAQRQFLETIDLLDSPTNRGIPLGGFR